MSRLSYVIWQEDNIVPQWVLEIVSKTPGCEYDEKVAKYAQIGVLYYVIYNPDYCTRDNHDSFEVYRLVNGVYVRQGSQPVWMPEVGLEIGCELDTHEGCTREWLYWYNQQGDRYRTPANVLEQTQQQLEQERQHSEQTQQQLEQERQLKEELLNRLRERGINLDDL